MNALSLFLLIALVAAWTIAAEPVQPAEDETAAIAAVLTKRVMHKLPNHPNSVILRSTTLRRHSIDADLVAKRDLDAEMVEAFRAANAESAPWDPALKLPKAVLLVDDTVLDSLMTEGGWARVQQKFQGAQRLASMSRAGFSKDRRAPLMVGVTGPLSGGGMLLLMRRNGTDWAMDHVIVGVTY